MKKLILFVAAATLCALSATVAARSVPDATGYDARVRTVTYNPDDIVQIIGTYGISTHIVFAPDEDIKSVALGDTLAWEVAPLHNNFFLKPREPNAYTNLSIITNRRSYEFELIAQPKAASTKALYYKVVFSYPQDIAAAKAAALLQAHQALHEDKVADALHASEVPTRKNINYWARGSKAVTPDEAFDDGAFTYFRFRGNREFPAVFLETIVDDKKTESLLNSTVKGDTIVVQRLSEHFILRKGDEVAEIVNKKYDPVGQNAGTGTITDSVTRVIKGEDLPPPATLPTRDPGAQPPPDSLNVYPLASPAPAAAVAPDGAPAPAAPATGPADGFMVYPQAPASAPEPAQPGPPPQPEPEKVSIVPVDSDGLRRIVAPTEPMIVIADSDTPAPDIEHAFTTIQISKHLARLRALPSLTGPILGHANVGDVYFANGYDTTRQWFLTHQGTRPVWVSHLVVEYQGTPELPVVDPHHASTPEGA